MTRVRRTLKGKWRVCEQANPILATFRTLVNRKLKSVTTTMTATKTSHRPCLQGERVSLVLRLQALGYPSKRVKVCSSLQANIQVGFPYRPGKLYQLCSKFEIILKFAMEDTLNSREKGKYYHRRQKITYFSDIYI